MARRSPPARPKRAVRRALDTIRKSKRLEHDKAGPQSPAELFSQRGELATPDLGATDHRRVRTVKFSVGETRQGVSGDPATAFAWMLRRRLHTPGPSSARIIDPQTGAVIGYIDVETRRRWQDAACTIPLLPPKKEGP